jgi:hypothetical protein
MPSAATLPDEQSFSNRQLLNLPVFLGAGKISKK